jgi:hypothetical protein
VTLTVTRADAGFWNTERIQALTARGIRTLVSPDNRRRRTPGQYRLRKDHYVQMRELHATEEGRALYKKRKSMAEPVFGRADQAQPTRRSLRQARVSGMPRGVATGGHHAQPPQAPRPPRRDRLIGESPAAARRESAHGVAVGPTLRPFAKQPRDK